MYIAMVTVYILTQRFCKLLLEELMERSVFWINSFDELVHGHCYGDCIYLPRGSANSSLKN